MKIILVQNKVRTNKAEENIAYTQSVFKALNETKPEGLRYVSFKQDDGVSFVHIASIETSGGSNPLLELEELDAFTNDTALRCEDPPAATAVNTIGPYGEFD